MSGAEEGEGLAAPRRILIVDDTPFFRELQSLFLARSGRVLTAASGDEALTAARREPPDLIVADLSMPGMDGDALCARVKADPALQATPVIVVTAGAAAEEHERAVRAGADDVLEKPLSRVSLIRAVNRCLRPASCALARVPLEAEVQVFTASGAWVRGVARDVSRGGMFVELEQPFEPESEIGLRFRVPPRHRPLRPTARVVWRRLATASERPGMGLQFLKLERNAARALADFVYENAEPADAPRDAPLRGRS